MVIYIDKTIAQAHANSTLNSNEYTLFSELATSYRYGYCIVCGNLQSLEFLANNLTGEHSGMYLHMIAHRSEFRAIVDAVEKVLVLTSASVADIPVFIGSKAEVVMLTSGYNLSFRERCCLLAENLNDCTFYEMIAKRYMYTQKIQGAVLNIRKENGGGNTIKDVLKKCVTEDHNITLCIVDSDKKYEHCELNRHFSPPPLGSTAKQVLEMRQEILQSMPKGVFDVFCIPVHEVENLIPLQILENIATEIPSITPGVRTLQKLNTLGKGNAILYYDLKNGIRLAQDGGYIVYWTNIRHELNQAELPGICAKILEKALHNLKQENSAGEEHLLTCRIDDYLETIWSDIGKKVFTWGCGRNSIRA